MFSKMNREKKPCMNLKVALWTGGNIYQAQTSPWLNENVTNRHRLGILSHESGCPGATSDVGLPPHLYQDRSCLSVQRTDVWKALHALGFPRSRKRPNFLLGLPPSLGGPIHPKTLIPLGKIQAWAPARAAWLCPLDSGSCQANQDCAGAKQL